MVGGSRKNLRETMVSTPSTTKYGAVSRKFSLQPILGGHPQPLLRVFGMDYNSNTWGYT